MGRINKGKQLEGSVINGFKLVSCVGYDKHILRCQACGTERPGYLSHLRKNKHRCKSCKPNKTELYTEDITDMYLDGKSGPEIAETLGVGITIIYPVIRAFRKNLSIEEPEVEYNYKEISEYLNISDSQARTAYKSGMKKIKKYLLSLDDFKDMA